MPQQLPRKQPLPEACTAPPAASTDGSAAACTRGHGAEPAGVAAQVSYQPDEAALASAAARDRQSDPPRLAPDLPQHAGRHDPKTAEIEAGECTLAAARCRSAFAIEHPRGVGDKGIVPYSTRLKV